jgi:RecG-like helicase
MGFHVANPLRDREFLENARKEAFALAEDSQRHDELRQTLRALPAQWQRRYHLAQIG